MAANALRIVERELRDTTGGVVAEALAGPDGLGALSQGDDDGERFSLRWILCHLIEEYARHNGHADLLRQAVDGATGE